MTAVLMVAVLAAEGLTLRQALELADRQNPDVVLARLAQDEAGAQARAERSGLLPQVSLRAGGVYQTSSLGAMGLRGLAFPSRMGPYAVLDARARLEQAVLDLPRWSAWRAAELRREAAGREIRVRSEAAKLAVAEIYFDALQAGSRARAAQARLDQAEAFLRQAEESWSAGQANRLDVARAAQRVEAERTAELSAQRDRRTLVTRLLRAIGLGQQAETVLAEAAAVAGDGGAGMRRAELEAHAARGAALEEELREAQRRRYPKVEAFGDHGVVGSSFGSGVSTYAVGVNVSVPVWTGGRIESEIQAARIRLEAWREQQRSLELQIAQEEAQAAAEVEAARGLVAAARRAVEASREALEMAQLRYAAGLTTNLDVVAAQSGLAESEEAEIQARYDRLRAEVRLARARGAVGSAAVR